MTERPGRLQVAATPIGNLADASPRLRAALVKADVIAAEDTRRLRALLHRLQITITAPVVSYFDGNEASRSAELGEQLSAGATVLLVTDAGMPSVSDPGFRLVNEAIARGVVVQPIPGPSAVLAALAVSGLAVDRFCFEGFAPRKTGERRRALAALAAEPRTMVFFEAPHRLAAFLSDAAEVFGDQRPAVVCRELTKTHEEVRRGPLAELAQWAAAGVRGEITVVVAGGLRQGSRDEQLRDASDQALAEVQQRIVAGEKLSAAVAAVATARGVARNQLYRQALDARD